MGRSTKREASREADCLVNGVLAVRGFARRRNFSCSTCCFISSILQLARKCTRRLPGCEEMPDTPTPLLRAINSRTILTIYIHKMQPKTPYTTCLTKIIEINLGITKL